MNYTSIKFLILFILTVAFASSNAQTVTTFAGTAGTWGSVDGMGAAASFLFPADVATDNVGNVYVADERQGLIRKITPAGMVSTLAIGLGDPSGLDVDSSGYVYVADFSRKRIYKISPTGQVNVFAGSGTSGSIDGMGTNASFRLPYGLVLDASGNVYVTDAFTIRKITPSGLVTTIAGVANTPGKANGSALTATFNNIRGIAIDQDNNLYVADDQNHLIRKLTVSTGMVSTLAGNGQSGNLDGQDTAASFSFPYGIDVDDNYNVYVGDFGNYNIRKISPNGVVTTLAGNSTPGSTDGLFLNASFRLQGLTLDNYGNMYVADYINHTIRKLTIGSPNALPSVSNFQGTIEAFPNPTTKNQTIQFKVELEESIQEIRIQILDLTGKVLGTQQLKSLTTGASQIELHQKLEAGFYMARFVDTKMNQSEIVKFVVE